MLGWDFWAAQHQRQLCLSIESTNKFLRDLWGVDEYKDVQKFVREHYAALTLYPLVERDVSDGVTDLAPMSKRASQLALDHPELFNATIWANLNFPSQGRFPVAALRLPRVASTLPVPIHCTARGPLCAVSTMSPVAWPKRSFTALKPSRSK